MVCWNCGGTTAGEQLACPHCRAETVRAMVRNSSVRRIAYLAALVGMFVFSALVIAIEGVRLPHSAIAAGIGSGIGAGVGLRIGMKARMRRWRESSSNRGKENNAEDGTQLI